jgi:hypothetical protein
MLKRYTKLEKQAYDITEKMSGTFKNNKVLRAVEQTVLDYQKKLGPVSNKNNPFNSRRKDYNQYMNEAQKWLKKYYKNWKKLFD